MKKIILMVCIFMLMSPALMADTSPSEATVKLYKIWLSTTGTCASLTKIWDASTDADADLTTGEDSFGTYAEVNFAALPDIGEVQVDAGTYNCMVYEMSDYLTFTPEEDSGTECTAGNQVSMDVCRSEGEGDAMTIQPLESDGSYSDDTATCADEEQKVWIFISTYSTQEEGGEDHNSFVPPTAAGDSARGFILGDGTAINFNQDMELTLTFKVDGKVGTYNYGPEGAPICNMEAPGFGLIAQ